MEMFDKIVMIAGTLIVLCGLVSALRERKGSFDAWTMLGLCLWLRPAQRFFDKHPLRLPFPLPEWMSPCVCYWACLIALSFIIAFIVNQIYERIEGSKADIS